MKTITSVALGLLWLIPYLVVISWPGTGIAADNSLLIDWECSPDGSHIMISGHKIVLFKSGSGEIVRVFENISPILRPGSMQWINNRSVCSWDETLKGPVIVDVKDGSVRRLIQTEGEQSTIGLAHLSPDGKRYACFVLHRAKPISESHMKLAIYSSDGKEVKSIPIPIVPGTWLYGIAETWVSRDIVWGKDSSCVYFPNWSKGHGSDIVEWNLLEDKRQVVLSLETFPEVGDDSVYGMSCNCGKLLVGYGYTEDSYLYDLQTKSLRVFSSRFSDSSAGFNLFHKDKTLCALIRENDYTDNHIFVIEDNGSVVKEDVFCGPVVQCKLPKEGIVEYMTISKERAYGIHSLNIRTLESRPLLSENAFQDPLGSDDM